MKTKSTWVIGITFDLYSEPFQCLRYKDCSKESAIADYLNNFKLSAIQLLSVREVKNV